MVDDRTRAQRQRRAERESQEQPRPRAAPNQDRRGERYQKHGVLISHSRREPREPSCPSRRERRCLSHGPQRQRNRREDERHAEALRPDALRILDDIAAERDRRSRPNASRRRAGQARGHVKYKGNHEEESAQVEKNQTSPAHHRERESQRRPERRSIGRYRRR